MRSSCSAIIRFVVGFFNLVFGCLFMALGVVGVLLQTNGDFLLKFMDTFLAKFLAGATKDQATNIAQFILKNNVQTSVFFIVIGFSVASVCVMGFFATCFSCQKLLQIYAIILTALVLLQAIAVGIIFGVPRLYQTIFDHGLERALRLYNPNTEEGKQSAVLWDFIMEAENISCCGMDGAADFNSSAYRPNCPKYCCNSNQTCTIDTAVALKPPVQGCREKVDKYTDIYMKKVLIVFICVIVAQAILAILTYAALKCKTASPI